MRENLGIEVEEEEEEEEEEETKIALNVMVQPVLFLLQNYILDMPQWFRFSPGDVDPRDRYSVARLDPSGTKLMCATMSATSELKTEGGLTHEQGAQEDTAYAAIMSASDNVTFLELKLQLTTYNINAFSATGSSFYDLVTGKMWLSPYAAEGDDGDCDTSVKVVVIDAIDGMEDATDFLTSLELRLSKRSYLGYLPTTVPQYVKYHQLRTGVNLLSSFRGGDEENLYLAQVVDKGLDESTPGLATRVPTCLLSCQHPAKNFFRSRQDAPASLDSFVETIKQCSELVKGVQDAMLVHAEPPSRDFSTFGGGSSPLKRASSLGSRAVEKEWVDEADSIDSLDM